MDRRDALGLFAWVVGIALLLIRRQLNKTFHLSVYGFLVLLLPNCYKMASPKATPDWQSKRLFEDTNGHMLHNEVLCDVTFLVGKSKTEDIKAHKFILASRSPVFYSMFCGSLAESSNTIKIPDIEPSAFQEFLKFIYTEDCEINEGSVMALLYSSKKYETARLVEKCMEYLRDQISTDNVWVILQHAHTFDEKELEDRCLKFVLEHGEDVLKSDGIVSVSKEVLQKIVDSDNLNCEELSVYNACKRWAIQQCKEKLDKEDYSHSELREQLGDMVYLIRFPAMSFDIFTNQVSKDEVLTQDEKVSIFQSIADPSTDMHKYKFRKVKRHGIKRQRLILDRFEQVSFLPGWGYGGDPDIINFTVSTQVKLLGVRLFTPSSVGTLQGRLCLQSGNCTLASNDDFKIEYDQKKQSEDVMFDRPAKVASGKEYSIYVLLNGPNSYYYEDGKQTVLSGNLVVSFFNNDESTNGTLVERGQIPALIFEI